MKKLPKLNRLSRGKKLFVQTYLTMFLIRLGMLLLPFNRLQNLVLKTRVMNFLAIAKSQVTLGRIILAVHRSSKYSPGKVMCLARALTTAVLMNIYELPYELKIGVAKGESGRLDAHAWVVSEGKIIMGNLPDLSRYVAMSSSGGGLIV